MKKVTFKYMRDFARRNNMTIYAVGYDNLQFLLKYMKPFACTYSKMNGWYCDYYCLDKIIISTGYNPIGQSVNYDMQISYDRMASGRTKEEVYKLVKLFEKDIIDTNAYEGEMQA